MARKKLARFPINDHITGMIKRHPQWPSYMGLPWYEDEFTTAEKCVCPHCEQLMVAYSYNFRGAFCRNLANLVKFRNPDNTFKWAHIGEFADRSELLSATFVKMVGWGVVEKEMKRPSSKKRSSGIYRLTHAGFLFVTGDCGIPKRLVQYMGQNIAVSGPLVMMSDCRDLDFDYGKEIEGNE